jgi:hypothetical protein
VEAARDTLDFVPARSWEALQARLDRTENQRHRQLLQVVINHVKFEIDRSLDGLMGTLVADPQYHFWSNGKDHGPKGYDAVRSYYEAFVLDGGAVFESIKERIVVDDDIVSHEGATHNLVSGEIAKRRGYTVPDATGHYLVHFRNNVWWSFDESGLALGEDSYTQFDRDAWERIPDQNLPKCYLDHLAEIGKLNVARAG